MNGPQPAAAEARPAPETDAAALILALQAQRHGARDAPGYWDRYCALLCALCRANAALLVRRGENGWDLLGQHSGGDDWSAHNWPRALEELDGRWQQKGYAFSPLQDEARRLRLLAAVRTSGIGEALLLIEVPERERGQLNDLILRALLAADLSAPEGASGTQVALAPAAAPAPAAGGELFDMLDLAAQVMNEQRFGAATLLLANHVAAHFGAAQVVLGWLDGTAMRVAAVSHLDRFERNTQNVALLEEAFLEALGQPGPAWYAGDTDEAGTGAHARLQQLLGFARVYTLPLADACGKRQAVLLLGFQDARAAPPADDLLLAMGLLLPWLRDLRARDRWWGARLAGWARHETARLIGPGQTAGRAGVALASALLLFFLLGSWDYRIEASGQMTTDSMRLISAQFDGVVEQVHASTGDVVRQGAPLATLDTRELRQQEMDVRAERARLAAEADKARASANLAELEISQARYAQAEARLNRILYYLGQARAVAPFDGFVVDGERKELLNAPVKKGDKLFRVARTDGLYVEMLVPEREVRYVQANGGGELRLLSRPEQPIPFRLSAVIPVAQVKGQEGNHFLIKARLAQAPEAWWRPGMSGIALIDGGRRNVAWILTHKLVDTLRMKLWWLW